MATFPRNLYARLPDDEWFDAEATDEEKVRAITTSLKPLFLADPTNDEGILVGRYQLVEVVRARAQVELSPEEIQ